LSSFHKKKNLNFLVHSWFKDTSLLSNLVKISLNIPTSVIRRLNCYWSNFYSKKNPIFLYKNISLCVGWWPGNLYTTNFFNLEINVNLVSDQNLWTFLLYLSISMHFDSVLLFVQILCIYLLQLMGQTLGIWKFLCKNSSTSGLLWCNFGQLLCVLLQESWVSNYQIFLKNGCQPCWVSTIKLVSSHTFWFKVLPLTTRARVFWTRIFMSLSYMPCETSIALSPWAINFGANLFILQLHTSL